MKILSHPDRHAEEGGLSINRNKTEVMRVNNRYEGRMKLNGIPLKKAEKFTIFCTNDKETTIFDRIFMTEYFIFKIGCSNSEKALE